MSISIPKYRKQIRKNKDDIAFVEFKSQRYHLGIYNSIESLVKYQQFLAEIQTTGGYVQNEDDELTITGLIARFWVYAEIHYQLVL
jgi:hypothetical protein